MKTVLVLSQHPATVEAIRAALPADAFRVVHRLDLAAAEPFLVEGLVDATIIDVEAIQVQGLWVMESVLKRLPLQPVVLLRGPDPWEWEEEAYLRGVTLVLTKPVRPRLLKCMLERCWDRPERAPTPAAAPPLPNPLPEPSPPSVSTLRTLEIFKNFSSILTHSLRAESLVKEFLVLLRAALGINRAAIFLREPVSPMAWPKATQSRGLHSASAMGLSAGLLEHFELSFESGIGGFLLREGRIVRRHGLEAARDPQIAKEFEVLGADVAVPILDRESLIGVAMLAGRVTGEALTNGELELVFHLLEPLGLAVRNIWLHAQLGANNEMLTDILRHLASACVVVSRDLGLAHINRAALRMFSPPRRHAERFEFAELPAFLASKVYQVLQTGNALAPFPFEPPSSPGALYQVTIVPIQKHPETLPSAALLMAEDRTQIKQLNQLEVETGNLRLVRSMAERLAHEIGNAMVPLAAYPPLLEERFRDAEFRASFGGALSETVRRVTRLVNQMRYLARDSTLAEESFPLVGLLEEACQEARKHQAAKNPTFRIEDSPAPFVVRGERAALRHALAEVILNGLQANPNEPRVDIGLTQKTTENGEGWVQIEVRDNGTGFTSEVAQRAPSPFFTTRTVGLGLGLSVCRKILDLHRGSLEILPNTAEGPGRVRLTLPLASSHPPKAEKA